MPIKLETDPTKAISFESSAHRTSVTRQGNWLIVHFPRPQAILSWAVVGGGKTRGQTVAWYQVTDKDLKPPVNPQQFLKEKLDQVLIPDAVGLLTSWDLDLYVDVVKSLDEYSARCIATVGLGNALRVSDPSSVWNHFGTINLLCQISAPLSEEALIESLAIAAEARTAAVLEANLPSTRTGLPSTGTGTDCIVIAAPESKMGIQYAGKHTALGHLIGSVVLEATRSGIDLWGQCQIDKGR